MLGRRTPAQLETASEAPGSCERARWRRPRGGREVWDPPVTAWSDPGEILPGCPAFSVPASCQAPTGTGTDSRMTGREFLELDSPQQSLFLARLKQMEIIQKMLNELPKTDQNLCNHGSYFLAANSSLCGLAANNFFRNILNIRRASLVSAVPMAVIPFLSTTAVYEVFVRGPLFSGQLNCEVCAVVRGGLVGAVVGALYPAFLALPLNASLAARYMSSPLPGKENAVRYWLTITQPVFRKMSLGVLVQCLTGLYLATKQHGIYVKILQQMHLSRDPEELK
ncbi:transmembrane protein 126A-like [Pipra filicauda]|uniref:Transmembrane protein 126A-like n=1 Tax=Pipra filicauda TaxID=649802 RepID=A0A7R5K0U3_9PASS|nr:transmembrane protein 126A-like [Pipra filicauda]